jgi:hypothetical protein
MPNNYTKKLEQVFTNKSKNSKNIKNLAWWNNQGSGWELKACVGAVTQFDWLEPSVLVQTRIADFWNQNQNSS